MKYREIRGILIRKYRNIFGRYVFVLEENGIESTVRVGKMLYEQTPLGTVWTIGMIGRKLISIRPGFCEPSDS